MGQQAVLYIVATPIGNLDDMTLRAVKVLKEVDVIAAEDTRHTRELLNSLGIGKKELVSYHDHVEETRSQSLVARMLADNISVALVSDAGTPCISDPGYRLVAEARRQNIMVHPIPGPSALTALLSVAGLPTDRFLFTGFLPTKESALQDDVRSWRMAARTIVFYEAPRRLGRVLEVIANHYPNAELLIGRELTKLHEECVPIKAVEAPFWAKHHEHLKGEAVVLVYLGGEEQKTVQEGDMEGLRREIARDFLQGQTLKDILRKYRDFGLSRSELYRLALDVKDQVMPQDE